MYFVFDMFDTGTVFYAKYNSFKHVSSCNVPVFWVFDALFFFQQGTGNLFFLFLILYIFV